MKRFGKLFALLLAIIMLISGCHLLPESQKMEYKSAGKLPPLEIPPDLNAPQADDRYAVPDMASTGSATYSSYNRDRDEQQPRSQGSYVLPVVKDTARIARSGTQRWLVVQLAPEDVWSVVKEFWQDMGFLLKVEAPDVGIMETDWAENRAKIPQDLIRGLLSTFLDSIYSSAERDKFRTRFERSESGNTEIYISHRGMDEVFVDRSTNRTAWQPRPADPNIEAEMLTRLMMRFGVEEESARKEVAANENIITQDQAYLDKTRYGVLIVSETFDRAWRRIGLALDRGGFTVEDRDRSNGVYFVRYVSPEYESRKTSDDKGLLTKLAFWQKSQDDSRTEKFRIQVDGVGASSEVKVLTLEGTPEESAAADRILKLLYEQLK